MELEKLLDLFVRQREVAKKNPLLLKIITILENRIPGSIAFIILKDYEQSEKIYLRSFFHESRQFTI